MLLPKKDKYVEQEPTFLLRTLFLDLMARLNLEETFLWRSFHWCLLRNQLSPCVSFCNKRPFGGHIALMNQQKRQRYDGVCWGAIISSCRLKVKKNILDTTEGWNKQNSGVLSSKKWSQIIAWICVKILFINKLLFQGVFLHENTYTSLRVPRSYHWWN